jgi:hypothetical protein
MLSYTPPSTNTIRPEPSRPIPLSGRTRGPNAPGTHAEACTAAGLRPGELDYVATTGDADAIEQKTEVPV